MRGVTSLPLLLVLSTVVCATKRAPVLLKAPPLACSWSTQPLAHLRPEPPPTTVVRLELLLQPLSFLLFASIPRRTHDGVSRMRAARCRCVSVAAPGEIAFPNVWNRPCHSFTTTLSMYASLHHYEGATY